MKNKLLIVSVLLISIFFQNVVAQTNEKETNSLKRKVINITKEEFFKKVYNYENEKAWKCLGDKPCIHDFYANQCGPCRMISPYLEQLAEEYKGEIYIYKINVDKINYCQ